MSGNSQCLEPYSTTRSVPQEAPAPFWRPWQQLTSLASLAEWTGTGGTIVQTMNIRPTERLRRSSDCRRALPAPECPAPSVWHHRFLQKVTAKPYHPVAPRGWSEFRGDGPNSAGSDPAKARKCSERESVRHHRSSAGTIGRHAPESRTLGPIAGPGHWPGASKARTAFTITRFSSGKSSSMTFQTISMSIPR